MLSVIDRWNWLTDRMDQLMNGRVGPADLALPAMNVWDDGGAFHAEAELPGYRIEDLELSVVGPELQIRGKRAFETPEGWTVHRQERAGGEFSRSLRFPAEIDAGNVQAALKDGVLSIRLPKAPSAKPRKIEVRRLGHQE